jgi:ketosteroid isomerase-like protein
MSAQRNVEEERQNAENVIRGHAAFNEGDVEGALRFISPEYELHPAVGGAFTGEAIYRGHDGFRRYIEEIKDVFEEFRLEPRTIATCGEWTVVDVEVTAQGHASGVAIDTEMTMIYRSRGGKAFWCATYFQHADALKDVGLSEDDLVVAA